MEHSEIRDKYEECPEVEQEEHLQYARHHTTCLYSLSFYLHNYPGKGGFIWLK